MTENVFLCEPVKWPQHRVQSPNIDKKTVSICPAYCNHRPGSRVHLGWWCTEQGWRWRRGTTQQSPAPSAEASTSLYTVASLSRVAGEDTAAAAAAPRLSRHHHRCVMSPPTLAAAPACSDHQHRVSRVVVVMLVYFTFCWAPLSTVDTSTD